jgi:hypothetical protein
MVRLVGELGVAVVVGGVADWSLVGVEPAGWGPPRLAVADLHGPAGVFERSVVVSAEQDAVVEGGRAAVTELKDVMCLAPARWSITTGGRCIRGL